MYDKYPNRYNHIKKDRPMLRKSNKCALNHKQKSQKICKKYIYKTFQVVSKN